jgi:hypothetical protein
VIEEAMEDADEDAGFLFRSELIWLRTDAGRFLRLVADGLRDRRKDFTTEASKVFVNLIKINEKLFILYSTMNII